MTVFKDIEKLKLILAEKNDINSLKSVLIG